jgi:hypothetical protein
MLLGQEKRIIESALAETKGRIAGRFRAAAKLGIPSSTLDRPVDRALKYDSFDPLEPMPIFGLTGGVGIPRH